MRKPLPMVSIAVTLLLLQACSPRQSSEPQEDADETLPPSPPPAETSPPPPVTPPALVGTAWVVEQLAGDEKLADKPPTLEFLEEQRASGRGGCNRFGGSVQIEGDKVRFGELLSTKMACDPPLMDQEQKFFSALSGVRGYRMEDGRLVLLDEAGDARVRLTPNNDPKS